MRAVQVRAPYGADHLAVVDVPDPGEPGWGELRVRVRATTYNFHDGLVLNGVIPSREGLVPLADGAGEVEAVGPGVTGFAVGDRVSARFFPGWDDGPPPYAGFDAVPGLGPDGNAQEVVVGSASRFAHAPRNLDFIEIATIGVAAVTAWNALTLAGGVGPGSTVLTLGTGGVSVYAVQLAKAMGATVIATSSSDEKLQRIRALGADEVINYRSTPAWGRRAREIAGGAGVDRVVEVGGAATLRESIEATRPGGVLPFIGVLTGTAGEVPTGDITLKSLRVHGVLVGSGRHHADVVRAIETADVHPVVDRVFPIERIADGLRFFDAKDFVGKVAIRLP